MHNRHVLYAPTSLFFRIYGCLASARHTKKSPHHFNCRLEIPRRPTTICLCLFLCLFLYLSLSLCLSLCLIFCLSLSLSLSLAVSICQFVSVCLCLCLFLA